MADIDESPGVTGWGLDLEFDQTILALTDVQIGSGWAPWPSDDDLSGVIPFGLGPVSGSDTLLATLIFESISVGRTELFSSVTPTDLLEGFALPLPGEFAEVSFVPAEVLVQQVPVPATSALLLFGWLIHCCKRQKTGDVFAG